MSNSGKSFYIRSVCELPEPFYFFNIFTRPEAYILPIHSHDRFHVNFITDGSVDVSDGKTVMTVNAGYALIVPPFVSHELTSEGGYSQIGMDINNVPDAFNIVQSLFTICAGRAVKVRLSQPRVGEYITKSTLTDMSPLNVFKCVNSMSGLLCDIIDAAFAEKASLNPFRQIFLQAAQKYALSGADLAELSRQIGFSKTHLERLVNREFGCSAVEYIARLRFSRVCSLLSGTDLSLSEISEKCGFCDSSHLSVFFRKRSGITPAKYRAAEQ